MTVMARTVAVRKGDRQNEPLAAGAFAAIEIKVAKASSPALLELNDTL